MREQTGAGKGGGQARGEEGFGLIMLNKHLL